MSKFQVTKEICLLDEDNDVLYKFSDESDGFVVITVHDVKGLTSTERPGEVIINKDDIEQFIKILEQF